MNELVKAKNGLQVFENEKFGKVPEQEFFVGAVMFTILMLLNRVILESRRI